MLLYQKLLLAFLGLVVVGAVSGFFLIKPLWEESRLIQKDIERERMTLAQILRTRAQIARFKQELADMDIRYKQISIMLPEAHEIPHLLKNVSNLGSRQGLEFLLFKPEKEIPREFVAEIPITLHLKGPYHQIGIFFDHLRRLPRIINVRQLNMGGFEEKSGQIRANCQLTTYRVLPPPPPGPAPKAEKKK
jgi:type IV pilus assembly protein PilO